MNIIRKKSRTGSLNEIRKHFKKGEHRARELSFGIGRIPRSVLAKLLIVCGTVGTKNVERYRQKASEIGAEFVTTDTRNWQDVVQVIRQNFDKGRHSAILLIGSSRELPSVPINFENDYAYTDWFFQNVNGDFYPEVPVGRIFGSPETVLQHMDPQIIDSNIAVIFDSEPGRTNRHYVALMKLGFNVEVVERFTPEIVNILEVSEFILQFSDGTFTQRIHGSPERWVSHNSVVFSYRHAEMITFKGYPVIFSEACSTAQEGPLLKTLLRKGACYIGAPLDTLNNVEPFENWKRCAYADGWKFGLLDLLDSYDHIGEVKVNVDRTIYSNLDKRFRDEIKAIGTGKKSTIENEQTLSTIEWMLFGNPLRPTTVGPDADYQPGEIIVDT